MTPAAVLLLAVLVALATTAALVLRSQIRTLRRSRPADRLVAVRSATTYARARIYRGGPR